MEYEFLRMLFDVCGISERLPFYDAIGFHIGMILAAEVFFSLKKEAGAKDKAPPDRRREGRT